MKINVLLLALLTSINLSAQVDYSDIELEYGDHGVTDTWK